MAVYSGINAQLGMAIEVTPGTAVAPARFMSGLLSVNPNRDQTQIVSRALRAGRATEPKRWPGKYGYTVDLSTELSSADAGILLTQAIGDGSTTGAGPYEHVYTPEIDRPSATLEVGLSDSPAIKQTIVGAFVDSWSITIAPGDAPVPMQLSYRALDETITEATPATATFATVDPFLFTQAVLEIDGTSECFTNLTISGSNNLDQSDLICATNPRRQVLRDKNRHAITGSFEQEFENLTLYNKFVAGTAATLTLTLTASPTSELVIAGQIYFDGTTPGVTGPEMVRQTLPFTFMHATSDASAFTATLTNSVATAV